MINPRETARDSAGVLARARYLQWLTGAALFPEQIRKRISTPGFRR